MHPRRRLQHLLIGVLGISIVGVELVPALRTGVEDRRAFVRAPHLDFAESHLRVLALRAFFRDHLLRGGNFLGDRESGKIVTFALQSGGESRG